MKYPEQILKGRKAIEGSLLGCLIKDIALIKEYNLNEDMFISTEGKFYFNILNTFYMFLTNKSKIISFLHFYYLLPFLIHNISSSSFLHCYPGLT